MTYSFEIANSESQRIVQNVKRPIKYQLKKYYFLFVCLNYFTFNKMLKHQIWPHQLSPYTYVFLYNHITRYFCLFVTILLFFSSVHVA